MTITTLMPTPSDLVGASQAAPRLTSLAGARIGVMFNAKPKALEMLTALADVLLARHGAGATLTPVRTEGVYLPSKAQFDALAAEADLVLIGLGDCGSCSACSVQVAADFERAGVPAIAICTEPFLRSGQAMAARQGLSALEFVTVAHPLSSLTLDEIRERAEAAAPQVASIACAGSGAAQDEAAVVLGQWGGGASG